jgi:hypothetical protein
MTSEAMAALFKALGGPAGVARLVGRDRSTTSRWLSGARPIPAWAAKRLREFAQYLASRMADAAIELKLRHIPESEARAARGRARRRQAFFDRFGYWPERRGG